MQGCILRYWNIKILIRDISCFLTIILLFGIQVNANGQSDDSLLKALDQEPRSVEKVLILRRLGYLNSVSHPDKALQYAEQGVQLSRRINYKRGEGLCLTISGDALESVGNFPQALAFYLKALKIQDEINADTDAATVETCIGVVYSDQEDYASAINYTQKARRIIEKEKDPLDFDVTLLNIGYYYYKWGKLDSALGYEQMAYDYAVRANHEGLLCYIQHNLGLIAEAGGNNARSLQYYESGILLARKYDSKDATTDIALSIANYYLKDGKRDSAIQYARVAVDSASALQYQKAKMQGLEILAKAYDKEDPIKAYGYFKEEQKIREDLYSADKVKQLANLDFDERLRQQELEEARKKLEETRHENLQLLIISLTIPLFFLLLLILTRTRVHPSVLDSLSVISVLLLFEFITFVVHPRIEVLTHHNAFFMLILLMVLASVMAPMHHHFSKWLKTRLHSIHRIPESHSKAKKNKGLEQKKS